MSLDYQQNYIGDQTYSNITPHMIKIDIATLDMLTPLSFPSCNSSPTHLPRHSWIQETRHQCFDHNFFIRHQNRVILDSLERGRRRRRF